MRVGFGNELFGNFPFGNVEWSKTATTDVVPRVYIEEDDSNGQPLQNLLLAYRDVLEPIRRKVDGMLSLRDPEKVPIYRDVATFSQLRAKEDVVVVSGALTGSVQFTNGSKSITGVGTLFTKEMFPGFAIRSSSSNIVSRVEEVISDTELRLGNAWPAQTMLDDAAERFGDRGSVFFVRSILDDVLASNPDPTTYTSTDTRLVLGMDVPPGEVRTRSDYVILDSTQVGWLQFVQIRDLTTISSLAQDLGVQVDDADPDQVSRSAIANAPQFFDLKGIAKSYRIIGLIYGFDVEVKPLWKVDITKYDPSVLATADLFETYPGSGVWLTSLPPNMMRFDEVQADVEPLDTLVGGQGFVTFPTTIAWTDGVLRVKISGSEDIVREGYVLTQNGYRFRVGSISIDQNDGKTVLDLQHYEIGSLPALGAAVLNPPGFYNEGRDYAKTAKLLVVIKPLQVSQGTGLGVDRIIERFSEVKPKHVELVRIVYQVNMSMAFSMSIGDKVRASVKTLVAFSPEFDAVPADTTPLDSGMQIYGTSTVGS